MFVGSGSLCDPKASVDGKVPQIDGLAHFCEHMLFLGTKKYPEENHYSKFIQQHGGRKNAATGEDYTYYYFDIKNDAFEEAVDIFSQFFKQPLFNDSATDRELNAVDNEYKKNISNENRSISQIEKDYISIPGSILNRFSTGCLETLQIPDINTHLKKFYGENYSSNLMNLVLVSRLSLDQLQKIAETNFTEVENRDLPFRDFSNEKVFDLEHSFGKIYKVIPTKNLKALHLEWIMPVTSTFDRVKSCRYLSHVLGHEGPNSLLSELIRQELATTLSAGSHPRLN